MSYTTSPFTPSTGEVEVLDGFSAKTEGGDALGADAISAAARL